MRKGITGAGTLIVCAAVGWSAAGCEDSTSGAPSVAARVVGEAKSAAPRGAPGITALTWNVYLGADIGRVLAAQTADEAVVLATEEWGHVQATDFPARAGALARAIAARRPHVVGLEELALYRTSDNPFEPATRVAYDFLQLVIDSLHARGVDYTAAAVDRTSDLQVPVIAGVDASGQPILAGVRWTDGDAVLVRADVPYADARSGVYAASQVVTIAGVTSGLDPRDPDLPHDVGSGLRRHVDRARAPCARPHLLSAGRSLERPIDVRPIDVRPADRFRVYAEPACGHAAGPARRGGRPARGPDGVGTVAVGPRGGGGDAAHAGRRVIAITAATSPSRGPAR